MMNQKPFRPVVLLILLLISGGTAGYHLIEGWTVFDSFYMTVITISTVGYGEIYPLTTAGRLWSVLIIIVGVGIIAIAVTRFAEQIADFRQFRRRKMKKTISRLTDHFILCGFGRMGKVIAKELAGSNKHFVIIEHDPAALQELESLKYLYISGDAVDEENLIQANVRQAVGLVSVLATDSDNLFLTMTARELNPSLYILTRSIDPKTSPKISKAGANKVLNPYEYSGFKMAQMLVRPHIHDFIDVLRHDNLEFAIEEFTVDVGSDIAGKKLIDSAIRSRFDLMVTAIIKPNGESKFNPSVQEQIEPGDRLIAIGKVANLEALRAVAEMPE